MQPRITHLLLGIGLSALALFAADSAVGTWKYNAAKSKSNSTNPLKSRTDVIEATADGGVKVTRTETRADGKTTSGTMTFKYDGKEYPVSGNLQYDTISAKRIDANTIETVVTKKGGRLKQTSRHTYSADGKTRTQTVTGVDAEGKPVTATQIYDRQ